MAGKAKKRALKGKKAHVHPGFLILVGSILLFVVIAWGPVALKSFHVSYQLSQIDRIGKVDFANCPEEVFKESAVFDGLVDHNVSGIRYSGTKIAVFVDKGYENYKPTAALECLMQLAWKVNPSMLEMLITNVLPPEADPGDIAFTGTIKGAPEKTFNIFVSIPRLEYQEQLTGIPILAGLDNALIHEILGHYALDYENTEVGSYSLGNSYLCMLQGAEEENIQYCLDSLVKKYGLPILEYEMQPLETKVYKIPHEVYEIFKILKNKGHFFSN